MFVYRSPTFSACFADSYGQYFPPPLLLLLLLLLYSRRLPLYALQTTSHGDEVFCFLFHLYPNTHFLLSLCVPCPVGSFSLTEIRTICHFHVTRSMSVNIAESSCWAILLVNPHAPSHSMLSPALSQISIRLGSIIRAQTIACLFDRSTWFVLLDAFVPSFDTHTISSASRK